MLAAHEARDANAVRLAECERKQQQRPSFAVTGNNDERAKALTFSNPPLPGTKEIEPLIRRGEMLLAFEAAPDGLSLAKVIEKIDTGDAACFRACWRICRPAFDRGSHRHCETCLQGIICISSFGRLLQRNVNKE
jgi:hypothetical protein